MIIFTTTLAEGTVLREGGPVFEIKFCKSSSLSVFLPLDCSIFSILTLLKSHKGDF